MVRQRNKYYVTIKDNIKNFPEDVAPYGTFLGLRPFYIRTATAKDTEMCVCKKHLHTRWAIQVLINCTSKQNIGNTEIYDTFFQYLNSDCETKDTMGYSRKKPNRGFEDTLF